jgi:hypothetical protein
MLTGRRMYDGETAAETLARIIEREPDLSALPVATPAPVRTVLERCLTKDPRTRLQAIGEARIALERAIVQPHGTIEADSVAHRERRGSSVAAWTLTAAFAIALAVMLGLWAPWRRPVPPAPIRVDALIGIDGSLMTDVGTSAVLSPDGQTLVFVAQPGAREPSHLYVRRLDQLHATMLAGTDHARAPFLSPDGQSIAFFAEGKMKKIPLAGGVVTTIADHPCHAAEAGEKTASSFSNLTLARRWQVLRVFPHPVERRNPRHESRTAGRGSRRYFPVEQCSTPVSHPAVSRSFWSNFQVASAEYSCGVAMDAMCRAAIWSTSSRPRCLQYGSTWSGSRLSASRFR